MSHIDDLHENYNNAVNKLSEAINMYAEVVSENIRNLKDKNERVTFLKNMKAPPSIKILKKVNEIAIEREDYETCEALEEYTKSRGLKL